MLSKAYCDRIFVEYINQMHPREISQATYCFKMTFSEDFHHWDATGFSTHRIQLHPLDEILSMGKMLTPQPKSAFSGRDVGIKTWWNRRHKPWRAAGLHKVSSVYINSMSVLLNWMSFCSSTLKLSLKSDLTVTLSGQNTTQSNVFWFKGEI